MFPQSEVVSGGMDIKYISVQLNAKAIQCKTKEIFPFSAFKLTAR